MNACGVVRPGTRTTIVWPGLKPSWRLYCATAMRRPALLAGIAPAGRRTRSPVGLLRSRTVRFMSFGNGIRHAREANGSQAVAARRWALAVGVRTSRAASAASVAFRMRGRLTGKEGCVRAIVVTRHGGPEVLELQDVPAPEAGPGELLVNVEAAGRQLPRHLRARGRRRLRGRDAAPRRGGGCRDRRGWGGGPASASRGATPRAPTPSRSSCRRRGRAGARRHRHRGRRRGDAPGPRPRTTSRRAPTPSSPATP